MKTERDQGRFNLFRLHCLAAFWRVVEALEPAGSTEMENIQQQRDRAIGALKRAQLLKQERKLNQGRYK